MTKTRIFKRCHSPGTYHLSLTLCLSDKKKAERLAKKLDQMKGDAMSSRKSFSEAVADALLK